MKKILFLLLLGSLITVKAQTGKFRTLNHFISDSANVYQFDSFDYVNVTITVKKSMVTVLDNKTNERKDYKVLLVEPKDNHTVLMLENDLQFHYHTEFKRVYFCSKDFKTYTEYKRH